MYSIGRLLVKKKLGSTQLKSDPSESVAGPACRESEVPDIPGAGGRG